MESSRCLLEQTVHRTGRQVSWPVYELQGPANGQGRVLCNTVQSTLITQEGQKTSTEPKPNQDSTQCAHEGWRLLPTAPHTLCLYSQA